MAAGCPASGIQFQDIRAHHGILASTGCTRDFCQAGRAIHTDEPRIGENRPISDVELEANDFLLTLNNEGFFRTEDEFRERMEQVQTEIRTGAVDGVVRSDKSKAKIGGTWTQTKRELEFGVRRAWRNSRKCIMRSHCEELELCDLRSITSSEQMAIELIRAVQKAFDNGRIQPTVFVFSPRSPNSRGPMILNSQILQFAGYEGQYGEIIGDPANVELTKAIIEMGWKPPTMKGRWDLLPLVTMAEGDKPYIAELPPDICKLVDIRHPQHTVEFEKLDLRWVPFPALTRLGFDIGGLQYTAAPFIGWFMDAEVGVRNLADTFRYNALPDVVRALGMAKGKLDDDAEELEDLPEYERLAMLSRAQAELNYAVYWSFLQAKVTMTDSLTASAKWCQYDDDFQRKNGFRLPSDPYWLAPPQGSLIPLWHRGGSPNYQPKPMITRHVQDPLKVWKRERHRWRHTNHTWKPLEIHSQVNERGLVQGESTKENPLVIDYIPHPKPSTGMPTTLPMIVSEIVCSPNHTSRCVEVYFCSSGRVAKKLAARLHKWIQRLTCKSSHVTLKPLIEPLNNLTDFHDGKTILLVVSSTGQGELPSNGHEFARLCRFLLSNSAYTCKKDFQFSIFGNGDSRYCNTFNGAALQLNNLLQQLGGLPLAGGLYNGDTALDPFPLGSLKAWFSKLEPNVTKGLDQGTWNSSTISILKDKSSFPVTVSILPINDADQQYDEYQQQLLATMRAGTLSSVVGVSGKDDHRSLLLSLRLGSEPVEEMSCIQILPANADAKVRRVLRALCVQSTASTGFHFDGESPTYHEFFTEFVDLELPFSKLDWLKACPSTVQQEFTTESLSKLTILEVLERLHSRVSSVLSNHKSDLIRSICLDMPFLRTRTYSLASSHTYIKLLGRSSQSLQSACQVSIMAKVLPSGRFSSTFLTSVSLPSPLKYRIVDSLCGPRLRAANTSQTPLVIIATGAGFGPVQALLQWRIASAIAAGRTKAPLKRGVSLFLGMKQCDLDLALGVINEALALDLIDILSVVLSCGGKRRVQDEVERCAKLMRKRLIKERGVCFVCTNQMAAKGTSRTLQHCLSRDPAVVLGERYLVEAF